MNAKNEWVRGDVVTVGQKSLMLLGVSRSKNGEISWETLDPEVNADSDAINRVSIAPPPTKPSVAVAKPKTREILFTPRRLVAAALLIGTIAYGGYHYDYWRSLTEATGGDLTATTADEIKVSQPPGDINDSNTTADQLAIASPEADSNDDPPAVTPLVDPSPSSPKSPIPAAQKPEPRVTMQKVETNRPDVDDQQEAQARTWTATDGRELDAEFISLEDGNISLRLKNGQIAKFPVDRLVKEDHEAAKRFAKVGGDSGVVNRASLAATSPTVPEVAPPSPAPVKPDQGLASAQKTTHVDNSPAVRPLVIPRARPISSTAIEKPAPRASRAEIALKTVTDHIANGETFGSTQDHLDAYAEHVNYFPDSPDEMHWVQKQDIAERHRAYRQKTSKREFEILGTPKARLNEHGHYDVYLGLAFEIGYDTKGPDTGIHMKYYELDYQGDEPKIRQDVRLGSVPGAKASEWKRLSKKPTNDGISNIRSLPDGSILGSARNGETIKVWLNPCNEDSDWRFVIDKRGQAGFMHMGQIHFR